MYTQYQTHGIPPTTEATIMADKDKYTDVATLRVAQQNVAEAACSIFWDIINLNLLSASKGI
jgi:hypothetical protein